MTFTDYDLCLAFDVAGDELECDFICDIERVQTDAYLNDDIESLTAVTDWMDAITDLPASEKTGVILAMMFLPTCNQHISSELECLHRARELDALDPTEAQLCAAGY